LTDADLRSHPRDVDLLDLDAALTRLATFDPRHAQIAELRFFGGLSLEETAHVVGRSVATVERDWQSARAWLFTQLTPAKQPRHQPRGTARSTGTSRDA
jgi:DNA-directed RNA polymerase specialized sigma24 family protein